MRSFYKELTDDEIRHTIAFDFDGVINPFYSGWCGIDKIPDPPDPKIIQLIKTLRTHGFRVVIMSSRALHESGYNAIVKYLHEYRIVVDEITSSKICAQCYVDDRSFHYSPQELLDRGVNQIAKEIMTYRPWWEVPNE